MLEQKTWAVVVVLETDLFEQVLEESHCEARSRKELCGCFCGAGLSQCLMFGLSFEASSSELTSGLGKSRKCASRRGRDGRQQSRRAIYSLSVYETMYSPLVARNSIYIPD